MTVIIAAHNAELYLAKAIESARAQTLSDIEIIVVDDGSDDATGRVADELALLDPRVIVVRLPENRGVSAARNAGLAIARGTWMAVLDADDEFAPERLEKMLDHAEKHGADIVADNLEMHDFYSGAPLGLAFPETWMRGDSDIKLAYVLERDIPGIHNRCIGYYKPIIRMDILIRNGIRYDESLYSNEDFLLYAESLLCRARMRFMSDAFYRYAIRPDSLSSSIKSLDSCKKVSDILIRSLKSGNQSDLDLLRLRRNVFNYELFIWHIRARQFLPALVLAFDMPFSFTLRRLIVFILRRLGRKIGNPTVHHLESIRRRNDEVYLQ